jgi:sugar lactone lactonase YvrE
MLRNIRSSHLSLAFKLRLSILLNVFSCLALLGVALPLWAQVTTTQAAVNFGSVAVGAATGKTQSLTFTIPSDVTLGGISAVTQGAPNLDFTVAKGGSCASGVTSATCTVQVRFLPTAPGLRLGAAVLSDQSSKTLITVPLSGIGTGPMVAFGPGIISTYAGSGVGGFGGDGGPATSAQLTSPVNVALDGSGNLYIADSMNCLVRKVTPSGTISTVAGEYCKPGAGADGEPKGGYSGDGGPATSAQLYWPSGVAVDGAGNLYIADTTNNVVRMVTPDGTITTVVGKYDCCRTVPIDGAEFPIGGYSGDGGPAVSAQLNTPISLAVDGAGNLYIADAGNSVIRKVTANGIITTVAGDNSRGPGYSGDGGPATSAQLWGPNGIAVDAAGNLYIADYDDNVVRKVTAGGTITTVAGTGICPSGPLGCYSGDGGPATAAQLSQPVGVATDGAGNLYISEWNNNVIRKVSPDGTITTVVGMYETQGYFTEGGYSGDGGPATSAQLNGPKGITVDGSGNLYIVDGGNQVIRKVDYAGAPSLTFSSSDVGGASAAQDVAVLNLGNAALTINQISTAANFSLSGADTSCSSTGQALSPGAECVLGIGFAPTVYGSISGSVVLTDNSLNASSATQSIALQGDGGHPTTTVLVATTGPLSWGAPAKLTATVSSATAGSITGTVTFKVGSTVVGSAPVSGGTATLSGVIVCEPNGFSIGSNTITASYGGDLSHAVSKGSAILTVITASYTLTATPLSVTMHAGGSATVTLNVATTNYTGSISFLAVVSSPALGTAQNSVGASAPPINLGGDGTARSTLTIAANSSAAKHAPAVPWKSGGAVVVFAVMLGAPFTLRRRSAVAVMLAALSISLAGLAIACGGGSSASTKVAAPTRAARTYTVTVTPTGTGEVTNPAPISITVTVQ